MFNIKLVPSLNLFHDNVQNCIECSDLARYLVTFQGSTWIGFEYSLHPLDRKLSTSFGSTI